MSVSASVISGQCLHLPTLAEETALVNHDQAWRNELSHNFPVAGCSSLQTLL